MVKDKTHLDKAFIRRLYGLAAGCMAMNRPDPENIHEPVAHRASGITVDFLRSLGPEYEYELPQELVDQVTPAEVKPQVAVPEGKRQENEETPVTLTSLPGKIGGAIVGGFKKHILGIKENDEGKESAAP
jgi:hypothetical protein